MSQTIFISGIDTDAGKSYATALLALRLREEGKSVITQKFIQTGNTGISEDIELHRRIMGTGMLPRDLDGTTAPLIFTHPCSAQLAARLDGREIDLGIVDRATATLASEYDVVLVEGAGGLMVPITDDFATIDYIVTRRLPLVLVTNGRLGSINHTILALEAIKARGIELREVIYNRHFDTDPLIAADTLGYITRYLARHFATTPITTIPSVG
ncbi:MAG: dethiobiotin synthase [Duncaniella sp.]|nr:dethiobiotin synthase [Duncaniella sp.]